MLFWRELSEVFLEICCNHCSCLGFTALSANNHTCQAFSRYFSISLLMFLLLVVITRDCDINHNGFSLLFVHHYNVGLVSHYHLISLYLAVPQDLSTLILPCFPFTLWLNSAQTFVSRPPGYGVLCVLVLPVFYTPLFLGPLCKAYTFGLVWCSRCGPQVFRACSCADVT